MVLHGPELCDHRPRQALLGDPKADKLETWEACVTAMQTGHALFVAARATTPAFEWHKDHWARDEELKRDSDGLIALGPPAVACLALDSGFTVEVESEYLPKYLLDGGWAGEFPT